MNDQRPYSGNCPGHDRRIKAESNYADQANLAWFAFIGLFSILILLTCGCGKMGPVVPPEGPTSMDDAAEINKKTIDIVDDSGKRLYELYGEIPPSEEEKAKPTVDIDELDEVPEQFRYLYNENEESQSPPPPTAEESKSDNQDNAEDSSNQ